MTSSPTEIHDLVTKSAVGISGSVYSVLGLPLSTVVAFATLIYIVCQIVVIIPKVVEILHQIFSRKKPPHE